MKAIKVIGHPVLLMSIYLLLIIEGQHFGGVYLLYLVLSIPQGAPYGLLALTGLLLVFTGYKVFRQRLNIIKPLLYIIGFLVMVFSLILFFSKGYNWNTFELIIPVVSFLLFGICSVFYLINSMQLLLKAMHGTTDLKLV